MSGRSGAESAGVHRFIYLSDIAGSSRLAEAYPEAYLKCLERHNALIEQSVPAHGGSIYKNTGDGYFALFEAAAPLVACTTELARAFAVFEPLATDAPLRVRIALHAGELHVAGREYFGPPLNRVSRICQVCNPGQVLLSGAVAGAFEGVAEDGLLVTDLGLHYLRDLAEPEQLYQLDHPGFAQHQFPPLATLNNRPNNLIQQPNRFVGRTRELEELSALLAGDQRLLTLVAPGGYGKSRLAAQLCASLLPRFERGCFMAYLAPVRDSSGVPQAIANALGFQFSGSRDPVVQLCDYLRAKELLLCLDNFEHVMESSTVVRAFLEAAPNLRLLITSREPLRIKGEQVFALDPMKIEAPPGKYSEAEKLFADRARLVNHDFALSDANRALAHDVCARLSGIPLAIELAAAWMDHFTLPELLAELGQQLELETRESDADPRHQSLKASLDWSWNLLGVEQQEMLMKLSAFRGGFFGEAASAMLGLKRMPLRATLGKLADKSWLYGRELDGQTRFYMRDALAHEYAFAKLQSAGSASVLLASGDGQGPRAEGRAEEGDQTSGGGGSPRWSGRQAVATTVGQSLYESAIAAHAVYYAALAEREGPRLYGGGTPDGGKAQLQAIRIWRTEIENINAALNAGLERLQTLWLRPIARYMGHYLDMTSAYFAALECYAKLHATAPALHDTCLLLSSKIGLGRFLVRLGRHDEAEELLREALSIAETSLDQDAQAQVLSHLAARQFTQGHYGDAMDLWQRSLALCRETGHRFGEAGALNNLASCYDALGDHAQMVLLFGQALEMFRQIGNRVLEAFAVGNLGYASLREGRYDRAADLLAEALPIFRETGNRYGEAHFLQTLASVRQSQGDYLQAAELLEQALAICREIGSHRLEVAVLVELGSVRCLLGDFTGAEELQTLALSLSQEIGNIYAEAQASIKLGIINLKLKRPLPAAKMCLRALEMYRQTGHQTGLTYSCAVSAAALCALDYVDRAAPVVCGAMQSARVIALPFEAEGQSILDVIHLRLDAAVDSGEVTPEQLAAWKIKGEAMSLDELAQSTLDALAAALDRAQG